MKKPPPHIWRYNQTVHGVYPITNTQPDRIDATEYLRADLVREQLAAKDAEIKRLQVVIDEMGVIAP